ncbi:TetR family transcriptional regulator [Panacagrimonas perspica]|uniref:TetR family transcriptional regulator n=1 Tax=Panacagrimonas perspica TaxID=381431 RepID=A0A4R7NP00_9GAMM|nr:TetR/AcrR family transcriptional regulator [Panacagrimonas perspica]TDU22467.1 TetR family transcriptional regulator [Panacagrimonas perspica]THD01401.1 TetR family transcriptional regulator [Panacagrimonas perspica]
MGTRERRQREVAEREDLFLDAALELIRQDGLLNLQMSRIAEKSEYAVGTLYLHFASKEDLLLALVTRVFREYIELVKLAQAWKASSRDRMFAVGVADMMFVRRYPDYFRIAQYSVCEVAWQAASSERRKAFLDANDPLVEIVAGIVEDARRVGDLEAAGQTAQEMAIGVWALCNGYHNLSHAEGILADFSVHDPYLLMCRHLQGLLDGFRWKPISDVADAAALDALIERVCREVFNEECNETQGS